MIRALAALLACVLPACGPKPASAQQRPTTRSFEIRHRRLREVSGLAKSKLNPGWLWTHNDSGGGAYLYAIGPQRRLRFRLKIVQSTAFDWEDIAVGPGPDGTSRIYIADTGRNIHIGKSAPPRIWVVPEPKIGRDLRLSADKAKKKLPVFRSAVARALVLSYPGGVAPDVEAVFLFDHGTAIGLISKSRTGKSIVYGAHLPPISRPTTPLELQFLAKLRIRQGKKGRARMVTAADLTPNGKLAIATYDYLFVTDPPALSVAGPPRTLRILRTQRLPKLQQIEALVMLEPGLALVATEGKTAKFAGVRFTPVARSQ